ncbi:expressed protein [Phakopsora pachyrhizi]|uniref:Expressed protein n=1 Tax=Phakopsora pachyrhizi TaxID=170000 RepID=A0AAV0BHA4_PHAPC|nr:expressed protein [Phakopsora pachyrhizi]
MQGAWLSLIPVTDEKKTTNNCSTSTSTNSSHHHHHHHHHHQHQHQHQYFHHINNQNLKTTKPHNHNHYPTANSILKSIVSDSSPVGSHRRKLSGGKIAGRPCSGGGNLILPLIENSSKNSSIHQTTGNHSSFEIRELQICDINKVKELHSASLPVSYPSWFFYDLLHKISLVATLPATNSGYFELAPHSSPRFNSHHPSFHPHHVTSPLSGRELISLDIIGSITAKTDVDRDSDDHFEGKSVRIVMLCVNEEYRTIGIGKSLIKALIQTLTGDPKSPVRRHKNSDVENNEKILKKQGIRLNLHVQAVNWIGIKFYLNLGFKIKKFKKDYYKSCLFKDDCKSSSKGWIVNNFEKSNHKNKDQRCNDEETIIRQIEKLYLESNKRQRGGEEEHNDGKGKNGEEPLGKGFDFRLGSKFDSYFLVLIVN